MPAMWRLEGVVQHYHWGDEHTLASLLGRPPSGRPEAEYWLGAHGKAPSRVLETTEEGPPRTLDQMIAADPVAALGPATAKRFGQLPFLFKILAVDQPLSIQAHPDNRQASTGFERENRRGIPLDSPTRNYRDRNHKPELICALTPMEAKCGFRTVDGLRQVASLFRSEPVSRVFSVLDLAHGARLDDDAQTVVIKELMHRLLTLSKAEVGRIVDAAVSECRSMVGENHGDGDMEGRMLDAGGPIDRDELARTVAWTVRAHDCYGPDVGVLVALLLNHIVLEPGQGLFLEAGNVHAYLSGVGVELMANSDNVLRCGLTSKHVDVDELLAIAEFAPGRPFVLEPEGTEHRFAPSIPEFSLVRMVVGPDRKPGCWLECDVDGPEIVLATGGTMMVESGIDRWALRPGEAVFVGADESRFRLRLDVSSAVAWRATIGR
jgi:mannose-6-phosphate isomerase